MVMGVTGLCQQFSTVGTERSGLRHTLHYHGSKCVISFI